MFLVVQNRWFKMTDYSKKIYCITIHDNTADDLPWLIYSKTQSLRVQGVIHSFRVLMTSQLKKLTFPDSRNLVFVQRGRFPGIGFFFKMILWARVHHRLLDREDSVQWTTTEQDLDCIVASKIFEPWYEFTLKNLWNALQLLRN